MIKQIKRAAFIIFPGGSALIAAWALTESMLPIFAFIPLAIFANIYALSGKN